MRNFSMEFSLEVPFMIEGENIFLIVPRYGPLKKGSYILGKDWYGGM